MLRRLLDPTLDIVFKMLFTVEPESEALLLSLVTAVLRPAHAIAKISVLNPAIPRDAVDDKAALLDLMVELEDGRRLDLEMQAEQRPYFRERALYYWARMFHSQIGRGDACRALRPAVSVLFLKYSELHAHRLHSVFQIREVHDQTRFSDAFELHLIELPELASLAEPERSEDAPLVRWSRFFAAETDDELAEATMNDPILDKARTALERLSLDGDARQLAEQRELALITYQIEMAGAREEGRAQGLREGLCAAIEDLCEALGVELDTARRARVSALSLSELEALRADIKRTKRWP